MPIEKLKSDMAAMGLMIDEVKLDSKIHRVEVDSKRKKNGWYVGVVLGDRPFCSFGRWDTGETVKWNQNGYQLSDNDAQILRDIQKRLSDEKKRLQAKAAKKANQLWNDGIKFFDVHPYLKSKNINSVGCRLSKTWEQLLIPIYNPSGEIVNLQRIYPDGTKKFLYGGEISGCLGVIHGDTERICICEGYATAASIHESTGNHCIIAFNAGNLKAVSGAVRSKYPSASILICGDNDESGTGEKYGRAAAESIGANFLMPEDIGMDWNDYHQKYGSQALAGRIQSVFDDVAHEKYPFDFIQIGNLEIHSPKYLIKKYLEADTMSVLFGDPGCGKSFTAIDIACSIATGHAFHGHKIITPGPVAYIAGEGQGGIMRRFMAWSLNRGIDYREIPVFVSMAPASLCDSEGARYVIEAVKRMDPKPVLVVIDTLARNFGPGDENSTAEMNRFVAALDSIRGISGASILIVHHTGHDNKSRARGSIALKGAVDVEYRLDKDEHKIVRMEATKMKDAEIPPGLAFFMRSVELPIENDDGEPITSAILETTGFEPQPKAGKKSRGKDQTTALIVLGNLYSDEYKKLSRDGRDENTARISVDEWRKNCYDAGISRPSFSNVKKSLIINNEIKIENGFVFRIQS